MEPNGTVRNHYCIFAAYQEACDFQNSCHVIDFDGGPGRIRTYNQQIMSLLL